MSKPSSAVKRKYNKSAYRRYEFSVGIDSLLNAVLERHKRDGGNISDLIKTALCEHYGISRPDADVQYSEFYIDNDGNKYPNNTLESMLNHYTCMHIRQLSTNDSSN